MSLPSGSVGASAAQVARDAQIHKAVEGALRTLEEHAGEESFRHPFDKALHLLVAIDEAGFRIVGKRSKF